MLKFKKEDTGLYVALTLMGAGTGLLVGATLASRLVTPVYIPTPEEDEEWVLGAEIIVEKMIPKHLGMGSQTALALAIGTGLSKIYGIENISVEELALKLGRGTVTALGTYGFKSVTDERGKLDLFNRPMHITNRAIADQLATAAELVMGETNERVPFVIIRGYPIEKVTPDNEIDINTLITEEDCMFLGPLLPCLEFEKKSE